MDSIIEEKSFDLAVRIVNLYKHLTADKKTKNAKRKTQNEIQLIVYRLSLIT